MAVWPEPQGEKVKGKAVWDWAPPGARAFSYRPEEAGAAQGVEKEGPGVCRGQPRRGGARWGVRVQSTGSPFAERSRKTRLI